MLRREWMAALAEDLDRVIGEVLSGRVVEASNGVSERVTFEHGHDMRGGVTGVDDQASETAASSSSFSCRIWRRGRVHAEHGSQGHAEGRDLEGLEHRLRGLLAVGLGVQGNLAQQHGLLVGRHAQLVVEGVVPDNERTNTDGTRTRRAAGHERGASRACEQACASSVCWVQCAC